LADLADLEQTLKIPGAFPSPPLAVLEPELADLADLEITRFSTRLAVGQFAVPPL